ncbi:hypothetical protein H5410_059160 [Solanum commersonii]|uniref:Uncharacterized protein n=1 Tax=Solanum commersonii TaxID=4109 RepID=A0A9J5W1R8_SOLCO|nr:hypothetical protein H5410_059160 [Solanum commersonii]
MEILSVEDSKICEGRRRKMHAWRFWLSEIQESMREGEKEATWSKMLAGYTHVSRSLRGGATAIEGWSADHPSPEN